MMRNGIGFNLLMVSLLIVFAVTGLSVYNRSMKERQDLAKAPFPINSCFLFSFETESQRPIYIETTGGKYKYAFVVMLDSDNLTLTECTD